MNLSNNNNMGGNEKMIELEKKIIGN